MKPSWPPLSSSWRATAGVAIRIACSETTTTSYSRRRNRTSLSACASYHQRDKSPGVWRKTPIVVKVNYEGQVPDPAPDAEELLQLMGQVVDWLKSPDLDTQVAVRPAMAHLHTVTGNPFRDGNGRITRIAQSLVLARDALLRALFDRGEPRRAHPRVLHRAPERPGRPVSARTQRSGMGCDLRQPAHRTGAQASRPDPASPHTMGSVADPCRTAQLAWDWLLLAREQSQIGGTDRYRYEQESGVAYATASNDFRRRLDAGLVKQDGRGRSTRYNASDEPQALDVACCNELTKRISAFWRSAGLLRAAPRSSWPRVGRRLPR